MRLLDEKNFDSIVARIAALEAKVEGISEEIKMLSAKVNDTAANRSNIWQEVSAIKTDISWVKKLVILDLTLTIGLIGTILALARIILTLAGG